MSPQMKGLVQFITDIRNSKEDKDEDKRIQSELVHIQKQFKEKANLSGYHRKKYICKLLYIYLIGNELAFGYEESIKLINSKIFSEKFIGYLSMQLYIQLKPELSKLIINLVRNDLDSDNEDFICLSLEFLSSIADHEIFTSVFENDIFNILRSPTTSNLIKKKASLTILKLLKCDSTMIIRNPTWTSRLIPLLNDSDLGLSLCVCSLLEQLAKLDHESCKPCINLIINRLQDLIIDNKCPKIYYYYGIPCPWLIVKLFNLLEVLIPDSKSAVSLDNLNETRIKKILKHLVSTSIINRNADDRGDRPSEFKNTNNFILFGAISLAAHIDPSPQQSQMAANALCSLLDSSETNTRYLSLDSLIKIATRGDELSLIEISNNFDKIFRLLKDRDVSIRRKSIDLIYVCCNSKLVENICNELLNYLSICDFNIKSEVAVKISVMAENYSTDPNWYIKTILKLLSLAGNYIEDEVWQRLIQIIINNDSIQLISTKLTIDYLKTGNYPESLLKVSCFLLGEFGYKVTDYCSSVEQFNILFNKYFQCSIRSRSMLLSCFLKFYLHFNDLRFKILNLFKQELNSFSSEIQQRSLEYLNIVLRNDNFQLLNILIVELPPFKSKISPLIARLGNVKDIEQSFKLPALKNHNDSSGELLNLSSSSDSNKLTAPAPPPSRKSMISINNNDSKSSLGSSNNPFDNLVAMKSSASILSSHLLATTTTSSGSSNLSPNWKEGYYRMIHFNQGVFYENSLIKIIYRLKRNKSNINFQLTYINKSPISINGLNFELIPNYLSESSPPPYIINYIEHPNSIINENERTNQFFEINIKSIYKDFEIPTLIISFVSGQLTTIRLKLPIVLIKCLNPGNNPLASTNFFKFWNQLNGELLECQKTIKINKIRNISIFERTCKLLGFNILQGIDTNVNNLVCSSILNTLDGNHGCLLRVEVNPADNTMIRLTMRCTLNGLAEILIETISDLLINGM